MSEFIFVYRFPDNYIGSPEAASLWESWFDALGTSLHDKGKAVFVRAATGDTAQDNRLGGYSLITAENIDAAVELAKGCPIVTSGGGVEVGELTA
jgi:hypothetical protein